MKNSIVFIICALIYFCSGNQLFSQSNKANEVKLICKVQACGDSLSLYKFDGIAFKKLQTVGLTDDSFVFGIPKSDPTFYYVGTDTKQKKSIIVSDVNEIRFTGNCDNMRRANVEDSPINEGYSELTNAFLKNKGEMGQIIRKFMRVKSDPAQVQAIEKEMAVIDERKLSMLENLKKENPFLAKIAVLETHLSFPNNKGAHANDLEHYVNEYFSFADLKDPVYNEIPYVFEAFKQYATTLSSVKIPEAKHAECIDSMLSKIPKDSDAFRYALGGVLVATQSKNHPNYLKYGQQFVDMYENKKVVGVTDLKKKLKSAGSLLPGGEAPDFTLKTPEGKDLSLSDLRGKVVLVDFWASWCGPCRKENPHVVKLYNEYKAKGFDVLGVSLDKKQSSWEAAIDKDGLTWHHVSDLKGWSNEVAKLYGVSSIPHTVLLDQEGKIIARNLRSADLEIALKKIFK